MRCEKCGLESDSLEDVCYFDINGYACDSTEGIEKHLNNPDALAHTLCTECAEDFEFYN